jgi:hypothetical protein
LNVKSGTAANSVAEMKKRSDFLGFMDETVPEFPEDQGIRVIKDNCRIHKKCDEWPAANPYVHFHYTLASASWLNMVGIWYGVMSGMVLRGGSFKSLEELKEAVKEGLLQGIQYRFQVLCLAQA